MSAHERELLVVLGHAFWHVFHGNDTRECVHAFGHDFSRKQEDNMLTKLRYFPPQENETGQKHKSWVCISQFLKE
jgi:hypothetical protein